MPGSYYRKRKMQIIMDNEKHAKIMKQFLNENEKFGKRSRDAGVPMEMTGQGSNIGIHKGRASKSIYIKLRFCLYIGPNHATCWLHTFQAKL